MMSEKKESISSHLASSITTPSSSSTTTTTTTTTPTTTTTSTTNTTPVILTKEQAETTLKFFHYNEVNSTFICGAIAGMISKTCIAPPERIKMTFQVSRDNFNYSAAIKRGYDIIHRGGVLSLWKGHSTTLLRVAPYAGLSYTFHDYTEHLFKKKLRLKQGNNSKNITLPPLYKFLSGAAAGFGGTILTYPLDVMRVRLALGSSWKDAIRQKGFFQGLSPTLLGIVPYSGIAWLAKQTLLEEFHITTSRKPTLLESLAINALAGLTGQFCTYPLDVIRRRMQIANAQLGFVPNLRESLAKLFREEGYRGFWKGFSLNIIKGPISLSISLTVYDLLRGSIQDFRNIG